MEHKIRIHDRVREIYERTRAFEPHPAHGMKSILSCSPQRCLGIRDWEKVPKHAPGARHQTALPQSAPWHLSRIRSPSFRWHRPPRADTHPPLPYPPPSRPEEPCRRYNKGLCSPKSCRYDYHCNNCAHPAIECKGKPKKGTELDHPTQKPLTQ